MELECSIWRVIFGFTYVLLNIEYQLVVAVFRAETGSRSDHIICLKGVSFVIFFPDNSHFSCDVHNMDVK